MSEFVYYANVFGNSVIDMLYMGTPILCDYQ